MKKKLILAAVLAVLTAAAGSCAPAYMKRDKFYTYSDPQKNDQQQIMMSSLNVEPQTQLFSGSLLFYDPVLDTAVCSQPLNESGSRLSAELVIYKDGSIITLSQKSSQYISAKIARNTSEIFYTEKNSVLKKTILSKISLEGTKKTQILQTDINSSIPYYVTDDGLLFYINEKNEIIIAESDGSTSVLLRLPSKNTVRKIAYSEQGNFVVFLASVAQEGGNSSSILYRLNLYGSKSLGEIDINVSDFVISEKHSTTVYVKSTMSGTDHVYIYDHTSALRKFLLSNNIEKISLSAEGKYILFVAKITEGLPTQSIWLANYETGAAVQLTVNTKILGQVFSSGSEDCIFFTETENKGSSDTEPVLVTYKMGYSFTNSVGENP